MLYKQARVSLNAGKHPKNQYSRTLLQICCTLQWEVVKKQCPRAFPVSIKKTISSSTLSVIARKVYAPLQTNFLTENILMCKEQSKLWLNSAYWKPLHCFNFPKYLYNQGVFLKYLHFCISPTRHFYNHIKQDLKKKKKATELKINSTWQSVFYSNTNSLLCIQQQHTSHFSVTATFICTVPLYQPPWFIPSLPHPFKNTDNNKQWKYSWCFLLPCQYHPS